MISIILRLTLRKLFSLPIVILIFLTHPFRSIPLPIHLFFSTLPLCLLLYLLLLRLDFWVFGFPLHPHILLSLNNVLLNFQFFLANFATSDLLLTNYAIYITLSCSHELNIA